NSGRSSGGVKFETVDNLLAGQLVTPRNPAGSLVYKVIWSGAMPPGGSLSHAKSLEVLECWITKGASPEGGECVTELGLAGDETVKTPTPQRPPHPGPGHQDDDDDHDDDDGRDDDDCDDDDADEDDDEDSDDDSSDPDQPPTPISFTRVYNEVLEPSCEGCHSTDWPSEGVSVSSYEEVMEVDGLVVPGDPGNSLLYDVVATDFMPHGTDPLPPEQKALLFDWIQQGAKP